MLTPKGTNPLRELPTCQKNHRTYEIELQLNIELPGKIVHSGPGLPSFCGSGQNPTRPSQRMKSGLAAT